MISRALLGRRLRQTHKVLAMVVGAQVLLWLASGLFMVAFDIDHVRGDHLRTPQPTAYLPTDGSLAPPEVAMAAVAFPAEEARLTMLNGRPVWIVRGGHQRVLVGARSGETWPAPSAEQIARMASAAYAGRGSQLSVTFLGEAPRETGASGPIWAVEFGPDDRAMLYLDPVTGEAGKIRTRLWRQFDFMWGLHIMDWSTRENFNSWWVRATATFGLLFGLSGTALLIHRLVRPARPRA